MKINEAYKKLELLESLVSYNFKNKSLLLQALTHSSFTNENDDWPVPDYERLEFLGDTILQMVITEMIFKQYPKDSEGELSVKRAVIVRKKMLADVAKILKLDKFIFLGKSELMHIDELSDSVLSDFVESLLAAIYLDGGYEAALHFCERYFKKLVEDVVNLKEDFNYKSDLQNLTQAEFHILPEYKVLDVKGPDHRKKYTVAVFVGEKKISIGSGFSKKQAENKAARKALEKLRKRKKYV